MQSAQQPVGGQVKRSRAGWLVLGVLLAACGEDAGRGIDEKCLEEGRCACRDNADCGGAALCVDGQCRAPLDTSLDTVQDTAPPPVDTAEPEEVVIVQGGFLWPCAINDECDSGKCLAISAVESVCTRNCIETCPNDWNCRGLFSGGALDFYCVPNRERLCEPCLVDEACPGEGNACVALEAGGSACGRACGEGLGACPDGFGCQPAVSAAGAATEQCVPLSGVCQCRPETAGNEVPCNNENTFGTCFGASVCQADGAVGACSARTPVAETCNGQDDDCNGFTDDVIAVGTCEVGNDAGRCVGERLCLPGAGEVCTAATPRAETCDNLDDDCDGLTDEDFRAPGGQIATLLHCGGCNASCVGRFANAADTRCDVPAQGAPRCVIAACEAGFVLVGETCARPPDLLCQPCTSNSVCGGPGDRCLTFDASDERRFCGRDCSLGNIYGDTCPDGYACREDAANGAQCEPSNGACDCSAQNDGQARPCSNQNAAGTCFGQSRCAASAGWSSCTARTPVVEACNGVDDDCDGVSDDGIGGTACSKTNTFGSCPGVQTCDGARATLVCVGAEAKAEVCNGIDDDCDGETDEDFAFNVRDAAGQVVALKYSKSNAHCGGCNLTCTATAPATAVSCDGSEMQPVCRVDACARGYWLSDAHVCLPVPTANLCQQCETDADCQGPDDTCVTGPAGRYCSRDCSVGSIYDGIDGACSATSGTRGCCPSGYRCTNAQCQPESGDCSCRTTGKLRACEVSNDAGSCSGVESCTATGAAAGWGACSASTPQTEVCNGIDDDCDGLVDSDDTDVLQSAPAGYPNCERVSGACTGRFVCGGDAGWLCTAREPETEICNGTDDDCDGSTDEGFVDASGGYTLVANCGQCGLDCNAAIANLASGSSAACKLVGNALTCVPVACAPGFVPFPSGQPRVCLPLAAASCRPCGVDAECGLGGDKCVPVGGDVGSFCAQPCGVGSAYAGCTGGIGQQGCCADQYACQNVAGASLCMPVTGSCQCSEERLGSVRGCNKSGNGGVTTCFGVETCAVTQSGYGWAACDVSANIEVCDGLDNNCDSQTDEGYKSQGLYILDSNCGTCGRNCVAAYTGGSLHATGVCDRDPVDPRCTVGTCVASTEPVGIECRANADCVAQFAGSVCDPALHVCRKGCTTSGDCGGGATCESGVCAKTCTTALECTSVFGPQSTCTAGKCVATFDWANLDLADGNGCECAAVRGRGSDRPDLLGADAAPGANYVDSDCDGVDGDVASAIFVRAGELAGNGSLAAPFGTITAAIAKLDKSGPAATSATPILVAGGVYEEAVVVAKGMVLHGGYADDFSARDIVLYPTLIVADVGAPGTVTAIGIDAATEVVGFTIIGWDATSAGAATYGLYVRDSTSALVVANCVVVGGRAAAGAPGGNGTPGGGGGSGANGANSRECATNDCSGAAEIQAGGAAGTNGTCASAVGCVGMEAEDESPQIKSSPAAGCTYAAGGVVGKYNGLPVEACKYDFSPQGNQVGGDGTDGGDGGDGNSGAGCTDSDGVITNGLWQGGVGTGGAGGGAGVGGNGGAAGGWATNEKLATCTVPALGANFGDLGGSGGGAGAGGCGGGAALAGASGGASFAAFVAPRSGSHPRLEYNTIVRGGGGAGGAGGNGGTGGRGGNGGRGGTAGWPAWGAGIGGSGGRGGDGGDAGGGGGGCGGPSYGIAGPGIAAATYTAGNRFTLTDGVSTSGRGGVGGLSAGAGAGSAGVAGESKNVKAF